MNKNIFYSIATFFFLFSLFLLFKSVSLSIEVGTKSTYLLFLILKTVLILVSVLILFTSSVALFFRFRFKQFISAKKTFIKNITTLLITLVVLFILLEGFLHLFDALTTKDVTQFRQADEILHHSFIPSSTGEFKTPEWHTQYEINSYGLRDYEFSHEKPDGTIRILMVGDSFTEGYGVELNESIAKRLEAKLPQEYHVINGGVSSYSPILEYIYLKEKGVEFNPDVIILNLDLLDVENDFKYTRQALFDEDGKLVAVPGKITEQAESEKGIASIVFSSKLLFKLKNLYDAFVFYLIPQAFNNRLSNAITTENILIDPYVISRSDDLSNYASEINLTKSYLLQISELANQHNIRFIIHVFPRPQQVSETEWISRTLNGFDLGKTYPTTFQDEIISFANQHNIETINSYDYFVDQEDVFFKYDYHWNAQGHDRASQALHDYLISDD